MAIGAFRMDANQTANLPSSGTGGFDLIGESSLPVTYDLNSRAGRDFYGLDSPLMKNVRVLPFRVHEGDEASCLNLNHAQTPRLLGVNAAALQLRHAFNFTQVIHGATPDQGWQLLESTNGENGGVTNVPVLGPDEIAGVGDENSILWAMGKKVGDTVDYVDARGRPFKVRLVGQIANSILQGSLIIDETAFLKRFPDESGYRMFLITAPMDNQTEIASFLSHALQDVGLELTPATARLNQFNAVQNTYLSTFQVLGGLGLLLGSAGLGVVVLRNVQERRGELALLLAVGFRRRQLLKMILSEHAALLILGLCAGTLAAAIAVMPTLLSPGARVPYLSLAVTAGVVLLNGLAWAWLATRFALRGKLLDALRNE
jgi:putative ABC transport system permease protein